MSKRKKTRGADLRVSPEKRLCPLFDPTSINKSEVMPKDMGVRVVDNCAEEHIQ